MIFCMLLDLHEIKILLKKNRKKLILLTSVFLSNLEYFVALVLET